MIGYRRMTAEDMEVFAAMRIRQLVEEGAQAEGDLLPALLDYYRRHLSDGTFVAWLALDGERIVGTGGISVVEKPAWFGCPTGRIGLVSSMYTDKAYRRQGIARRLLTLVTDAAKEQGCGAVWITASDMGVPFYAGCGFVHNGNFMQCKL
ncbi:MAG: GNAT family N-acetyltransferase [Clostridia bacterium]|nr:GNAT family N-acetyltransferase [Clostridia bacterium]